MDKIIENIINNLLNEYLDKNMTYLKTYMSQDTSQKNLNLAYKFSYLFPKYLKFIHSNFQIDDNNDDCYEYIEKLSDEDKIKFGNWVRYHCLFNTNGTIDDSEFPSNEVMKYTSLVKNKWLVHFSNDADLIAMDGFKYGTPEADRLALTYGIKKREKGYNFAYDADDIKYAYNRKNIGNSSYGKEAGMFMASGIKCFHEWDNESQVIFWGPSAKNFIYFYFNEENGEWEIPSPFRNHLGWDKNRILYKCESFQKVTVWIKNNFRQYQKIFKIKG